MSKQESKFTNFLRVSILLVGLLVAVLLALNLYHGGVWILQGLNGSNGENGVNGSDGKDGQDGKSAYELACENGFEGSLHEWLLSLAVRAEDGKDGENGKDAVGIRDVRIDADGHLIVTLTDGSKLDAGYIDGDRFVSDATDGQGFYAVCETVVLKAGVEGVYLRSLPEISDASVQLFAILPGAELLRVGDQQTEDGFSRFVYQGTVCYAPSKYFDLKSAYEGEIPEMHLPEQIALIKGKTQWFYSDQILGGYDPMLRLSYSYGGSGACAYDGGRSFSVTPDRAEEATLTVRAERQIDGAWRTVAERLVRVNVVDVPKDLSLKGILIGDSRISDNTVATALASSTGGKPALTLMGTRHTGSSTVAHEGRSGWSTAHFLNNASLDLLGNGNAVPNAFFDPATNGFSFAYYMQTQGYETPDFVLINLGANDNFSRESVDRIHTMVASIQAYSAQCGSEICIFVMTEYLSPAERLGVSVNIEAKREKQFRYFTYLQEVLGGREDESIYLLPNYLAIDDWSDWQRGVVDGEEKITDAIHLGYQGYYKEEQMIRAYLYWLFGA